MYSLLTGAPKTGRKLLAMFATVLLMISGISLFTAQAALADTSSAPTLVLKIEPVWVDPIF